MGSPPSPTHLPILIPMLHLLLRIDGGSSAHPLGQTPLLFILPLLPGVDGGGGSPTTHTPLILLLPFLPLHASILLLPFLPGEERGTPGNNPHYDNLSI